MLRSINSSIAPSGRNRLPSILTCRILPWLIQARMRFSVKIVRSAACFGVSRFISAFPLNGIGGRGTIQRIWVNKGENRHNSVYTQGEKWICTTDYGSSAFALERASFNLPKILGSRALHIKTTKEGPRRSRALWFWRYVMTLTFPSVAVFGRRRPHARSCNTNRQIGSLGCSHLCGRMRTRFDRRSRGAANL